MSNENRRQFLRSLVSGAVQTAGVAVVATSAQAANRSGEAAAPSIRNFVMPSEAAAAKDPAEEQARAECPQDQLAWGNIGWRNGGGFGGGWRNAAGGWGGGGWRNAAGGWGGGGWRNGGWRNGYGGWGVGGGWGAPGVGAWRNAVAPGWGGGWRNGGWRNWW